MPNMLGSTIVTMMPTNAIQVLWRLRHNTAKPTYSRDDRPHCAPQRADDFACVLLAAEEAVSLTQLRIFQD
jgi:hypothetical protein